MGVGFTLTLVWPQTLMNFHLLSKSLNSHLLLFLFAPGFVHVGDGWVTEHYTGTITKHKETQ